MMLMLTEVRVNLYNVLGVFKTRSVTAIIINPEL